MNGIEDFLKTFSAGGGNIDPQQAQQMHDRFVSTRPEDSQYDASAYHEAVAQQLGQMPDDQFQHVAQSAMEQAQPQQRQDLLGGLLGALGGGMGAGGGGIGQIAKMLGLGSTDPQQMSGGDATKVMDYARKEQPDAMRTVVAQQPWLAKAMGNPVVMGALTMVASQLLSRGLRGFGRS